MFNKLFRQSLSCIVTPKSSPLHHLLQKISYHALSLPNHHRYITCFTILVIESQKIKRKGTSLQNRIKLNKHTNRIKTINIQKQIQKLNEQDSYSTKISTSNSRKMLLVPKYSASYTLLLSNHHCYVTWSTKLLLESTKRKRKIPYYKNGSNQTNIQIESKQLPFNNKNRINKIHIRRK